MHKIAIRLSVIDIKGISSFICMHKFLMEENHKTMIDHQG